MRRYLHFSLICGLLAGGATARGDDFPDLPPAAEVRRLLADAPTVRAALAQRDVELAQQVRLAAGPHEWSLRAGGQQRRVRAETTGDGRYGEWSAGLERPLRLPGKAGLDASLGAAGVALADTALGDARHEFSRLLLKSWFAWLRENAAQAQWQAQVALLDGQARAVRRRQQLGDAARLETLQAEAALAQAEAQRAQAAGRAGMAAEMLRQRFPGIRPDAPVSLDQPQPLAGDAATWVAAVLAQDHELRLAEGGRQRAALLAERARAERLPDPTLGVAWSRERGGEEQLIGAYISIPLPGRARNASADAAAAEQVAAGFREEGVRQRIAAEAAAQFHAAQSAVSAWEAARLAAVRLTENAALTARAYRLGEGSLGEVLTSQRLANDAALAERAAQVDAQEARYRLLLDTHQLWDFD